MWLYRWWVARRHVLYGGPVFGARSCRCNRRPCPARERAGLSQF